MKRDKKTKKAWLKFLFLGGFLLFLFKKERDDKDFGLKDLEHNFLDFARKEGKEVSELIHHKEDIEEYIEDSQSIFRDYFIPHKGNNHHPKILRKKQLLSVLILAILFKVSLISYLFFIYPNDGRMSEDIQMGIFNMLNEERVALGLEPLVLNQSLLSSATDKVDDMIVNNYFAHKSLDGRMPWDFVSKKDYPYLYIGENLGMSFSSAKSVHNALMNSPGHKKNILNEKYTDVGVVVKKGIIDGKETNILVQLFGTEKVVELIPNPAVALAVVEKTEEESIVEEVEIPARELEVPKLEELEEIPEPESKEVLTKEPIKESVEKVASISKEEIETLKQKIELENKQEQVISSTSPLMLGDRAKTYIEKKVPEPNLELDLSDNIKFVANTDINDKYTIAARLSDYLNILLIGVLFLMSAALFLNIFVRLKIQHKPAIIQTLLLLVLLFGIYSTRLHFLEDLPSYISIF